MEALKNIVDTLIAINQHDTLDKFDHETLEGTIADLKSAIDKAENKSSYLETHYEMVQHLTQTADFSGSLANVRREKQGIGGLYELAEDLTNEFEKEFAGREWDGEFFDEIEAFLRRKEIQARTTERK